MPASSSFNPEPGNGQDSHSPVLAVRGIHKSFPGVHALRGVDLEVHKGEVLALCGENGAGKSTLMHILAGVCQPDSGHIFFDERGSVHIENEHAAQSLGISMVYQERNLVGSLSIAENIHAGRQPVNRFGLIDSGTLFLRTAEVLSRLGLVVDPRTLVVDLAPAQQQMVEIARAISRTAKVLIFDEPTSALTAAETTTLFRVISELKWQGAGIIYISHRLEEIFRIADRAAVLKDGEYRGTSLIGETTPAALIARMVGRELTRVSKQDERVAPEAAVPRLEVRRLTDYTGVCDVSFSVARGEILALAGLAGAGRTELALALFGAAPRRSGDILVDGASVPIESPADAIAAGLAYVPEDRREAGLFLEMSVAENVGAAHSGYFGRWWWDRRQLFSVTDGYRQKLRISTSDLEQPVQNLSGGNQQKVVLARWLLLKPRVLIVDKPTCGIDVGAKTEVHELLCRLAAQGNAVVLISSELPEILAVADRILVMREGRICGELDAGAATEEEILRYATTGMERPDTNQAKGIMAPASPTGKKRRTAVSRELGLAILIVAAVVVSTVLYPNSFPTFDNLAAMLRNLALDGVMATGMMLLLISGVFDLSIGGTFSLVGVVTGWLLKTAGVPVPAAVMCGLCVAAICGLVNGFIVAKVKVNALITTLGTMQIFRGAAVLIGGPGIASLPPSFSRLGQAEWLGLQSPVWLMVTVVVLFQYLLTRTPFFRQYYYIGGNQRAARLCGMNVERMQMIAFTIMGLLAGLAGMAFAARLGTSVSIAGDGAELRIITAVILGGASLTGGKGTVWGSLVGVVLMALLNNIMIIAQISSYWQSITIGLVLVTAVAMDHFFTRRS